MPVRHRVRTLCVSKYGMGHRLWRGLHNLVHVAWLKHRLVQYRVQSK